MNCLLVDADYDHMIAAFQKHICANEFITRHYSSCLLDKTFMLLLYGVNEIFIFLTYIGNFCPLWKMEASLTMKNLSSKLTKWSVVAAKL